MKHSIFPGVCLTAMLTAAAVPCAASSDNHHAALEAYSRDKFVCPETVSPHKARVEYLANTFEHIADINPYLGERSLIFEYAHFLNEHHCQISLDTINNGKDLRDIHKALWEALPSNDLPGPSLPY